MFRKTPEITIVTDGSGDGVGLTERINGRIDRVIYTEVDYAAGADMVIATAGLAVPILAIQNIAGASAQWKSPLFNSTLGTDGTALTGAGAQRAPEVADEQLRITISNGGSGKSGKFVVVYSTGE